MSKKISMTGVTAEEGVPGGSFISKGLHHCIVKAIVWSSDDDKYKGSPYVQVKVENLAGDKGTVKFWLPDTVGRKAGTNGSNDLGKEPDTKEKQINKKAKLRRFAEDCGEDVSKGLDMDSLIDKEVQIVFQGREYLKNIKVEGSDETTLEKKEALEYWFSSPVGKEIGDHYLTEQKLTRKLWGKELKKWQEYINENAETFENDFDTEESDDLPF